MKKLHYSWIVCLAAMLAMLCNMGLCSNILAVYLPFIEETGITGSQGSAMISIRCIASFICTFLVSLYYKKISLRAGLTAATVIGAIGAAVCAIGGSVYVYYAGVIILGIAYGFGTMVPISLLVANWFNEDKATAVSICSMGSGFASILFGPVITANTIAHGLRSTFLLHAAFCLVCAAVIYILVRSTPEEMNLTKLGAEAEQKDGEKAGTEEFEVPNVIWAEMLLMLLLLGGAGQAASGHVSIVAKTAGYSAGMAGMIASLFGAALIGGKLLFGVIADRTGTKRATVAFMTVFMAGCLSTLLLSTKSAVAGIMFALILGIGCPFFTIGVPLWAGELTPTRDYEKTVRWFQIMYSGGGIIFTAIPGRIADATGEYISSYMMLLVMTAVSMALLLSFYRKRKNQYRR